MDIRAKLSRAAENMAMAGDQKQFLAMADVFNRLKEQEKALEQNAQQLHRPEVKVPDMDEEIALAISTVERIRKFVTESADLARMGVLFRMMNARLLFRFTEGRWKKRVVTKVAGGEVTFGSTPPPVALYDGPTSRKHIKGPATPDGAAGPDSHESPGPGGEPGGEGGSLGNVCRGDWIRTSDLLNPIQAR